MIGVPASATRSRRQAHPMHITRRHFIAGVAISGVAATGHAQSKATPVEVWKSPTCGCCKDWIEYLAANGFQVSSHDEGNSSLRAKMKMPERYGSCHTALV